MKFWLALVALGSMLAVPDGPANSQAKLVFDTTTIQVATAERRYLWRVQLAISDRQMAQGLMFRKTLKPYDGMLFVFEGIGIVGMWMKNTVIPLDMLFIKADGTVESIKEGVPHSLKTVSSSGPVRAVLEIPRGTSRRLGIEVGDRIRHELFGTPLKPLPSYKPKTMRQKRS